MKKVLILMLSCLMLICLTACNGNDNSNGNIGATGKSSQSDTQEPQKNTNDESIAAANTEADATPQGLEPLDDKPKTIVVSILGVTPFYKLAKEKYEALHPNTTIQFKEFTSGAMMSASEVEKYIKSTTTEVLSGKGADLFAFTTVELPIDKYVKHGAFENVDDWIKRDAEFNQQQYQMNIMEGSKMNGGLYIMPIEYYLEAMFGNADEIQKAGVTIDDKNWTWSQFADISKQLAGKKGHPYAMGLWAPEIMVNNLVSDNYARLIDGANGKASFDTPFFTELLTQVKKMYDDKVISADFVDFKESDFYYSLITSPSDYLLRAGMYFENGKLYQKPHAADQKSGISFLLTNQIAMNANSEVKRDAWEFMKFLLSEEMQSYPKYAGASGFSMNKAVNEKAIEDVKANGIDKNVAAKGGGAVIKITDENLDALRDMLSEASLRNMGYETTVQKIIAEEVKAFFAGQKSADDVAKLIQNRITTYLNE
ncbi:ABC transporter substrate-binding protein [Paenibacillus sp. OV219]|uniref:ABC transporter substrate-binding protein n=1 Tax=Paenibacillus sp. OV219 TaxID=1884377 RepID=UPI0008D4D1DD|nr:extracellular solute-binding protein [Paenibacillus sp. OV219]SEM55511.1 multiple sugar transport system substrate-binding protein [Paenibacillus sp. OV219]